MHSKSVFELFPGMQKTALGRYLKQQARAIPQEMPLGDAMRTLRSQGVPGVGQRQIADHLAGQELGRRISAARQLGRSGDLDDIVQNERQFATQRRQQQAAQAAADQNQNSLKNRLEAFKAQKAQAAQAAGPQSQMPSLMPLPHARTIPTPPITGASSPPALGTIPPAPRIPREFQDAAAATVAAPSPSLRPSIPAPAHAGPSVMPPAFADELADVAAPAHAGNLTDPVPNARGPYPWQHLLGAGALGLGTGAALFGGSNEKAASARPRTRLNQRIRQLRATL